MKKKITIVDKDLNQLVVVADCSSALYQDRGTKLGEQNLLSDTAVTFKVYDGTVQVAVMMADILQVPTKQGTMADIWPTPANPLPDKQLAINYLCARNAERQLDVDDYTIDNILRCGYNPGKELNDVVHTTAQNYARTLIRSLKEKGVDLTLSYPVFIGGGSILMRPVIESELGRDDYLFIDDPRANAVGYKMMAESRLAAESR